MTGGEVDERPIAAQSRSSVTVRRTPPVEEVGRTLHSALLSVTPGQEYADPIDLVI